MLIRLLAKPSVGLQVNDNIVAAGDVVFRHACQLGLEGIVSKRLGSLGVSELREAGIEPEASTPDELRKFQAAETEKWKKIAADAKIEPE